MSAKVFISGSISIKHLHDRVKESIRKIRDSHMEILVGDANGIDRMVQNYCEEINYLTVTVYSIYSVPRFKIDGFKSKHITPDKNIKKERERQTEKDKAMTNDCDFCLVIWDGKSKGSYSNILGAIKNDKKFKIFLNTTGRFMESETTSKVEIDHIYRQNNGYTASEIVDYLNQQGMDTFKTTRMFNKYLVDNKIIKKENGVYLPMPEYDRLFMIDIYRGRVNGIKFTDNFIAWIEDCLKKKAPQENKEFDFQLRRLG